MTELPELDFQRLVKIGGSYSLVIPKAFINHGLIDPNKPLRVKISQNKEKNADLRSRSPDMMRTSLSRPSFCVSCQNFAASIC